MMPTSRMLSRPIGVWWAGWRTDTHRLQQSGWNLSVDFQINDLSYRLAMRHEAMRLHAITAAEHFENEHLHNYRGKPDEMPVFNVIHVASSIQSMVIHGYDFSQFKAIDATPQITNSQIQRIEDMNIFASVDRSSSRVMIDKADMSVIEHLEAIKNLQSTKQQELRRQQLATQPIKREAPRLQLVASFAHYEAA